MCLLFPYKPFQTVHAGKAEDPGFDYVPVISKTLKENSVTVNEYCKWVPAVHIALSVLGNQGHRKRSPSRRHDKGCPKQQLLSLQSTAKRLGMMQLSVLDMCSVLQHSTCQDMSGAKQNTVARPVIQISS